MKTRRFPFRTAFTAVALLVSAGFLGCGGQDEPRSGPSDPAGHAGHAEHESSAASNDGHRHHGGHEETATTSELLVASDPAVIEPERPVELRLTLRDATGETVTDFETVHDEKLHLIIVRDALDRFAHIHPEIDPAGNITTTFSFPTAGKYRLYADYKPAGGAASTAITQLNVVGTPPPSPHLVPNVPGRVTTDELAADVAIDPAGSDETTRITFTLFDAAGKPATDLQPYLGAMGHLVVLSADGSQYVHAHPVEGTADDGVVAFEAHFPAPGIYRGWGQFRRSGKVHDVPFVVKVE